MSATKSSDDAKLQLIKRIERAEKISREGYASWKKENKIVTFNYNIEVKVG